MPGAVSRGSCPWPRETLHGSEAARDPRLHPDTLRQFGPMQYRVRKGQAPAE